MLPKFSFDAEAPRDALVIMTTMLGKSEKDSLSACRPAKPDRGLIGDPNVDGALRICTGSSCGMLNAGSC